MVVKGTDDYLTIRFANPQTGQVSPNICGPRTPSTPGEALRLFSNGSPRAVTVVTNANTTQPRRRPQNSLGSVLPVPESNNAAHHEPSLRSAVSSVPTRRGSDELCLPKPNIRPRDERLGWSTQGVPAGALGATRGGLRRRRPELRRQVVKMQMARSIEHTPAESELRIARKPIGSPPAILVQDSAGHRTNATGFVTDIHDDEADVYTYGDQAPKAATIRQPRAVPTPGPGLKDSSHLSSLHIVKLLRPEQASSTAHFHPPDTVVMREQLPGILLSLLHWAWQSLQYLRSYLQAQPFLAAWPALIMLLDVRTPLPERLRASKIVAWVTIHGIVFLTAVAVVWRSVTAIKEILDILLWPLVLVFGFLKLV